MPIPIVEEFKFRLNFPPFGKEETGDEDGQSSYHFTGDGPCWKNFSAGLPDNLQNNKFNSIFSKSPSRYIGGGLYIELHSFSLYGKGNVLISIWCRGDKSFFPLQSFDLCSIPIRHGNLCPKSHPLQFGSDIKKEVSVMRGRISFLFKFKYIPNDPLPRPIFSVVYSRTKENKNPDCLFSLFTSNKKRDYFYWGKKYNQTLSPFFLVWKDNKGTREIYATDYGKINENNIDLKKWNFLEMLIDTTGNFGKTAKEFIKKEIESIVIPDDKYKEFELKCEQILTKGKFYIMDEKEIKQKCNDNEDFCKEYKEITKRQDWIEKFGKPYAELYYNVRNYVRCEREKEDSNYCNKFKKDKDIQDILQTVSDEEKVKKECIRKYKSDYLENQIKEDISKNLNTKWFHLTKVPQGLANIFINDKSVSFDIQI